MSDDLERDATKLASELLRSVGLSPTWRVDQADRDDVDERASPDRIQRVDWNLHAAATSHAEHSELIDALSRRFGLPAIDPLAFEVSREVLELIPFEIAAAYGVMPVNLAGNTLIVATHDPRRPELLRALTQLTGFAIEPIVALAPDLRTAIDRSYRGRAT